MHFSLWIGMARLKPRRAFGEIQTATATWSMMGPIRCQNRVWPIDLGGGASSAGESRCSDGLAAFPPRAPPPLKPDPLPDEPPEYLGSDAARYGATTLVSSCGKIDHAESLRHAFMGRASATTTKCGGS